MKEDLFFLFLFLFNFIPNQCPILLYRDRKSTSLHHYRQETRENPERFSLSKRRHSRERTHCSRLTVVWRQLQPDSDYRRYEPGNIHIPQKDRHHRIHRTGCRGREYRGKTGLPFQVLSKRPFQSRKGV